jgi:hypothetical protein
MSKLDKLKVLLARVEQRRTEPRLVAVSNASALASANTNVAAQATAQAKIATLELAPKPALAPIEEAFAPSAPSSIPPPPPVGERPSRQSSLPPVTSALSTVQPPSSTVPPSMLPAPQLAPPEPIGRASTEVLPATAIPIVPSAPAPFDSAVRVTSPARIDAPKTFGELLEQSLALRPKSG